MPMTFCELGIARLHQSDNRCDPNFVNHFFVLTVILVGKFPTNKKILHIDGGLIQVKRDYYAAGYLPQALLPGS